jgi:hypothetical protein
MDAGIVALVIPIAAIVTGGAVKIVRVRESSRQGPGDGPTAAIEARLAEIEHDLNALRGELSETQERLDFTERLLSQAREDKRIE